MNISSLDFADGAKIPKAYTRLGGNRRPTLRIAGVPANAKSLAVICHDPDAPGRDGFYHWTVWNLPPETTEITGNTLPNGAVEGITSWGRPGWDGPQPPFGTHRYQFYVYALDTTLDLPASCYKAASVVCYYAAAYHRPGGIDGNVQRVRHFSKVDLN